MSKNQLKTINLKFNTGSKKALKYLFDLYYQRVCSYAFTFVKDEDIVSDLVQEVFIKLWNKKLEFESHIAFKSYLYNSVKNKCISFLRIHKVNDSITEAHTAPEDSVDQKIIETEIQAKILQQVNLLPKSRREVILLKLEGLTYEEIANQLNLSLNTVKSHKKLAYKQLKDGLQDLFFIFLI